MCNKTVSGCFLYKRLQYCNCSFVGWVQCMRNGKETIKRKKLADEINQETKKFFFLYRLMWTCYPYQYSGLLLKHRIMIVFKTTIHWLIVIITHLVFQMLQKVYLRSISSLSPNNLSEPKHYYNVYTAKYSVSSQLMIYLKQNYY